MPTVSDVTVTPLSGLNYIDALLDSGPDWNFQAPAGYVTADGRPKPVTNVLYYTFSITSGNEDKVSGQEAFTTAQQVAARTALRYISDLTHIQFVETVNGTDAQIHLCNIDIQQGPSVTGLCSWTSNYSYDGATLKSYDADAYVYLDNVEWRAQNRDLTPGGEGYETLLHELGHALGLQHPFKDTDDINEIVLPASQDKRANTLMSYDDTGGPYSTYRDYDIAALKWLYGGDGLGGELGIGSTTGARYIAGTNGADVLIGTSANDTLEGDGGNDMINGGEGNDTAVFRGNYSNYAFTRLANGDLTVASKDGIDGTDTLTSIEVLQFADMKASRADVGGIDTTPPKAPTMAVTKNANGYTTGSTPLISGQAEANATIKLYTDNDVQIGTTKADANGVWSVVASPFNDGLNYKIYATATDAAGNTSVHSDIATFNVDGHAPVTPTASLSYTQGSNQATFSGTGEAGTLLELIRSGDYIDIARVKIGADGHWEVTTSPLPNGSYEITAVSSDLADNATSAATRLTFTVANPNNLLGTDNNDVLRPGAGNNAVDGQRGLDTVVYDGTRASYTVAKETWGFGVTDNVGNGGHDALINVERVQFSDGWLALDIDGVAGQAFRLYQAAFDRPAEAAGQGFWMYNMDRGITLLQVAQGFLGQKEFTEKYGVNPTDAEFVNHLYANVLHRAAEGAGYDFWMDALQNKHVPRAEVLMSFSESLENKAQVIASIQDGITFTPWHTT